MIKPLSDFAFTLKGRGILFLTSLCKVITHLRTLILKKNNCLLEF